MKRRTFIQSGSLTVAGLALYPSVANALSGSAARKIGIQLYTLRDVLFKDAKGVLKSVAEIGFTELETFGYRDGKIFGMPFFEYVAYVDSLGLKTVSGHYGIDLVRGNWEQVVSDAKSAGQEYAVVPYLPKEQRTEEGYKQACADINKAGETCKQYGIKMGYHNHDFEFEPVNGEPALDLMMRELSADVSIEMDLYWIIAAGKRPQEYFAKYPGRFEQWHVKDMDKVDPKRNASIGKGSIDYKALFALASQAGMKHFYVEHDNHSIPSLDSVREGYTYLNSIL